MTELSLSGNGLSGTLPIELAELAQLSVLDVHNTWLSGTLPSAIAELEQLSNLQLSHTITQLFTAVLFCWRQRSGWPRS